MAGEMRPVDQLSDDELEAEIARLKTPQPLPDGAASPGMRPAEDAAASAESFYGNPESETKAAIAGLKRTGQKIYNGGAQGFLQGRKIAVPQDPANDIAIADLEAEERANKRATDPIARAHPFGYGLGESLPLIPMGGGFLASATKGGLFGSLKYGNPQERAANALVDAGATAVGNFGGRMAGGFLNPELSAGQRATLQAGRARGVYPRLSQVTRNPDIEGLEDFATVMPLGHGINRRHDARNSIGFNRTAAESMGQQPDEIGKVGPEVFAAANRDIPRPFQAVDGLGGLPIDVSTLDVSAAASRVLHRQTLRLTPDGTLSDIAQKTLNAAQHGGRMTGEAYQALRSELTNEMYKAFANADGKTGTDYKILLEALDNSADASLRQMGRADLADDLLMARDQWGNYKTLTTGRIAEGGDVLPSRVATAVRANNPDAFRTGRTDGSPLGFLARWAEDFPPLVKGSQTAGRAATGEVVKNPASLFNTGAAIPSAIIAKATTSPAMTWWPARAGGTPVGKAAQAIVEPTISGGIQSLFRRILRPQTP